MLLWIKVKDLIPLHSLETVGKRPDLERLSDDEMSKSVTDPRDNNPVRINTRTGKVIEGNSRTYELKRRAGDPGSRITPDTKIPYIPHSPDISMFDDL